MSLRSKQEELDNTMYKVPLNRNYVAQVDVLHQNWDLYYSRIHIQELEWKLDDCHEEIRALRDRLERSQGNKLCRRCRRTRAAEHQGPESGNRELPPKKEFRKNLKCQAKGCKRKYSSLQALKYHVKHDHAKVESIRQKQEGNMIDL